MKRLLSLILSLFVAQAGFAAGKSDKGDENIRTPVPLMTKVRTGTLASGLQYFLLANNTPENRAYLTLAVNAGSVLETEDERGLAHFVEHMGFNGTERFPENELNAYMEALGLRFGADFNAYTSFDKTVYGIMVPTEQNAEGVKVIPEKALNVLDDWTHRVLFNPKDVDEERPIILEEKRMRDNAFSRIYMEQVLPIITAGSPYAVRAPIGIESVIQNAPASRLEGFYKKWYRADNMALIFVGDFDINTLEASLETYFTISKPSAPLMHPYYDLPKPKPGTKAYVFRDTEISDIYIALFWKRSPKAREQNLNSYRREILDWLADFIIEERLGELEAEPSAPFTNAYAGNLRYGPNSRFWYLSAYAKTGLAEESLDALLREQERISRYGLTNAELDRAKAALLANLEAAAREEKTESQDFIRVLTAYYTDKINAPDPQWELVTTEKLLSGIDAKELTAFAKDYFKEKDLNIFIIGPEDEKLPAESEILKLVKLTKRLKNLDLPPPSDKTFDAHLLELAPKAGNIKEETVDAETGAVLWQLENGATVIAKQTPNKQDEIVLYALARGGYGLVPETKLEQLISARRAASLLSASGFGPYNMQDLTKKLAAVNAKLSFDIDVFTRNFSGAASVQDLETLFELLYLRFSEVKLDSKAVESTLSKYRTYYANQDKDPEALFFKEVSKLSYDESPYFRELELGDLELVKADEALAFLQRALNPADFVFAFVGNLNLTTLKSLVQTYIASLPASEEKFDAIPDPELDTTKILAKIINKGKEDKSHVWLSWLGREPYSEQASATARVLQEYLDITFTKNVREKLGGVYSIYAGVQLSPLPPPNSLKTVVYFPCDPKHAEELALEVKNELQDLAAGAIDKETLDKAKEAMKKSWEISVQDNLSIAFNYAYSLLIYAAPLSRLDKRPGFYSAVDAEAVQALVARILDGRSISIMLFPE